MIYYLGRSSIPLTVTTYIKGLASMWTSRMGDRVRQPMGSTVAPTIMGEVGDRKVQMGPVRLENLKSI